MHLETTGEAAGMGKKTDKETESNLACSRREQFEHHGFVFSAICSLVSQRALVQTEILIYYYLFLFF